MTKQHMSFRRAIQLSAPLAMIDLFALMLLTYVVNEPQFLKTTQLPILVVSRGKGSASASTQLRLSIDPAGELKANDESVTLDEAVHRVRSVSTGPVRLEVQLDSAGRGAVARLVDVQLALSAAGLMQRIQLLHRTVDQSGGIARSSDIAPTAEGNE